MKTAAFALRNGKEILRDRLNLIFGIGFPIVLLLLLTMIQSNIPVDLFRIQELAPGVAVFGLSFISLFSGILISKDRTSSFMLRLFVSPMRAGNFIWGYILPLLPMAVAQTVLCYIVALFLGLSWSFHIVMAVLVSLPAAMLFIGVGLLCGSLLNDKQVGGICGALLTNVSAWLSGTWFSLDLVGGGFKTIAELLPFCHAVEAGRYVLAGEYEKVLPELLWVVVYAAVVLFFAVWIFTKKMKSNAS